MVRLTIQNKGSAKVEIFIHNLALICFLKPIQNKIIKQMLLFRFPTESLLN